MKNDRLRYRVACVCTFVLATAVLAEVPPLISVQGELGRINAGVVTNLANPTQAMDMRLYAGTNRSVTLFGRTNITVLLEQGKFSAEFGNGAALTNAASGAVYMNLPDLLADAPGSAFSLGLRSSGAADDFIPPIRLQSVPFALMAADTKQATRSFDVRNGTASLRQLVVQGETVLKGPVTFEAGSAPVFGKPVSVVGDMRVTGGDAAFSALTVEGVASISNATLNGVSVSSGAATIKGALTVSSGMTTVTGATSVDPLRTLAVTETLTVRDPLLASTLTSGDVTVTGTYTLPAGTRIKRLFGSRVCINTPVATPPTTASGWSNAFYQVTATSGAGSSHGYWRAPQDCFVVVNHVVGRYSTGEQSTKPISVRSVPQTTYAEIRDANYCIALPYSRLDLAASYAAHKGAISIFMKKDQYLCWYSDYDNEETVFGAGYMRELSVLYFAN